MTTTVSAMPAPAMMPTTDDAFLGGRLAILQPATGYRAGLDAVLLAAATPVMAGAKARVLDAGAGVGVVGLAIATRVPDARILGLEIDADLVALARCNAHRNGLGDRVEMMVADIGRGGALLHDPARPAGLDPGNFQHVVANPPFYGEGSGTAPASSVRRVAHQMPGDGLGRWIALLATAAATGATLTLIHRADALDRILAALDGRFGAVRIRPVHPTADRPAARVLIWAVKGSRAPLTLLPGLVLHDSAGRNLPEIEAILRHGAPLMG